MNKTEFLIKLEKSLKGLNKEELNDILGEYSQHIDNKISEGKNEIDSINDFGDINTLSKEILSAYSNIPYFKLKYVKNTLKYNFNYFANVFKYKFKNFSTSFINSFKTLIEKNNYIEKNINSIENYSKKDFNNLNSTQNKTKTNSLNNTISNIFLNVLKIILTIFLIFPLICFAIPFIILFATSIILSFQGYPLIGLSFILCGLSFCTLTILITLMKFVFSRRKDKNEKIFN